MSSRCGPPLSCECTVCSQVRDYRGSSIGKSPLGKSPSKETSRVDMLLGLGAGGAALSMSPQEHSVLTLAL
jgi:hypothetical protein